MKCIKNKATGEIKRVPDEEAMQKTKRSEWGYCPKHEWKKKGIK